MTDDIYTRVVIDTSEALAASLKYSRALERVDASLAKTAAAQAKLDAALASSGAGSDAAIAAQAKYDAALRRTQYEQDKAAIAAKRSSEIQVAAAEKAAAAQQASMAKQSAALSKIGVSTTNVGVGAAAAFALAVKSAADFNAQIAKLQTLSGASAAQVQALSDATKDYANLGISASQAADAEIELTKAGVSVNDILGGALKGTLTLAAAGQLDVADATEIAAQAMTQFGLAGQDLPHIADLLSAGANKALGSVQDLGTALSYAGGPAHQLGVSIEDTVATLAEFAQAGLVGEKGGAALQTMFARLVKPTGAAAAILDQYNISLYDTKGNFVGMSALAGEFRKGLSGLSVEQRNAALQTVFGNRAFRAAAILYEDGAKGAKKWADAVNDAGNAEDTAKGQLNSLTGDFQKLTAQVENAAIALGDQFTPALRGFAQGSGTVVGGALSAFDAIPDRLKRISGDIQTGMLGLGFGNIGGDLFGGLFGGANSQANAAIDNLLKRTAEVGRSHGGFAAQENSSRALGSAMLDLGVKAQTGMKNFDNALRAPIQSFNDLAAAADDAWKKILTGQQAVLSKRGDFRSYQQAIDDANAALKENGKTLDQDTQKGRDNADSLDTLATTASAYAQTIKDPVLQLKFLQESRHQLEQTAESFGMSKQAAWAYVNQVLGIPKDALTLAQFEKNAAYNDIQTYKKAIDSVPGFKDTVVTAKTEAALRELAHVQAVANNLHGTLWINVQYTGAPIHSGVQVQPASGGLIANGRLQKFAGGGFARYIRGPGTGTSDSIPAMVSNGEFINKESVVRREGPDKFFALNQGRATIVPKTRHFSSGGFAGVSGGGGSTVVMSDPAILRRLESIERALSGTLNTNVTNAGEVASGVRGVAHGVVRANAAVQEASAMAQSVG